MAWDQLSINKPHLVYIILGGFTSLFMLCSSVIKERLYIGEATVATICGIIFGPHAANLINPFSWGNTDQITLEFSRIVLVVQCFAVGVELPKAYMERHWRSVTFLLIPVMTVGWLVTSLFIWGLLYQHLTWLESLVVAACVTATDPVLASSVVGKGKFAKRVPKHLRDLLSAESGCNDGMAFPFVYLALYIMNYRPHAGEVMYHWFCYTILYECIFGAIYGVLIGYIARRAVRTAHERDLIDRESFLVFYFVLALFCAGSGSLLGLDDLLVGFACGVGFSNDGWFTEKTEESHVSNVIDLLINLAFFVYFGAIIPWEQFNSGHLGLDVWRLVVIALLVLFFRRIPIMLALKPVIPDIKTWREALFAGHFGPIGVGAIFVAILARAELETDSTTPLDSLPPASTPEYNVIYLIWPITTFLVVTSIVVHGSSVAVFTLGKHINTLTLTMSYTQPSEQGPSWMERLPRIQSRSKSYTSAASLDEKTDAGGLPVGVPGTFLRRQKEEDNPSRTQSRASSRRRSRKSRNWESGRGPGGPISQSAITPTMRRSQDQPERRASDSETLALKSDPPSASDDKPSPDEEEMSPGEIYEEGKKTVFEDEEGNVLAVEQSTEKQGSSDRGRKEEREGRRLMREERAGQSHGVARSQDELNTDHGHEAWKDAMDLHSKALDANALDADALDAKAERPGKGWRTGLNKMTSVTGDAIRRRREEKPPKSEQSKDSRGPARAYQYGNTIIVEDEDGEVIKKYDIPALERNGSNTTDPEKSKHRIGHMGKMLGRSSKEAQVEAGAAGPSSTGPSSAATVHKKRGGDEDDDKNLRFTITQGGPRMSKVEFINQIRQMDPKSRVQAVENSNAPEAVKREARMAAREKSHTSRRQTDGRTSVPVVHEHPEAEKQRSVAEKQRSVAEMTRVDPKGSNEVRLPDSHGQEVPLHDHSSDLTSRPTDPSETAAKRRRRLALEQQPAQDSDSEDDGTDRVPPARRTAAQSSTSAHGRNVSDGGETAAERRRREGALGISRQESDSEEDEAREAQQPRGIRFADEFQPSPGSPQQRQSALKWGEDRGR